MLYTAGIGLEAELHTQEDRQSAQQGRPGSVLGPVTLGWWASQRGSCPGLVRPRCPGGSLAKVLGSMGSGMWAQCTSFRAWWDTRPSQEGAGL